MFEFPTMEQMAKEVAEQALDEYIVNGKTLREWIAILADAKPAEWLPDGKLLFYCSNCKEEYTVKKYNFCPNCGKMMKKEG